MHSSESVSREVGYGVGIPTKGRTDILVKTVQAFIDQSFPPEVIVIVDNNDEFGELEEQTHLSELSTSKTRVGITKNDFAVPGIIQGDQTTLKIFTEMGFKIAARWDDDLVPEKDCMEYLVKMVSGGDSVAAGGMYPGPNGMSLEMGDGFSYMKDSGRLITGNDNPRHLQFFRWSGYDRTIWRSYLHSSFVYDAEMANLIGGFCTQYSQHSFRAETDFTLRMNALGPDEHNLAVNTMAKATHFFCDGGTRDITGLAKKEMVKHDLLLFDKRMRSMGIDPNY